MPPASSPAYNEAVPEDLAADSNSPLMQPDADDAPVATATAELETRIADLEAERDALQRELDTIKNRATDRWLSAAQFESQALAAMQKTVSWRVTKPLRAV